MVAYLENELSLGPNDKVHLPRATAVGIVAGER
jgi:hypothetical protein